MTNQPGDARIAYLVKRFPRLSETFILDEIVALRRTGLALRLYALMDPAEKQVQAEAAALQPEVVYLHDRRQRLRSAARLLAGTLRQLFSRPIGGLRVLWALLSVHRSLASLRHAVEGMWLADDLRRQGVTHLHAHFVHSPAAVAYFARLAGGPRFSMTAHAKDLYTTLPRNLRIRGEAADFLVTCTGANADYLRGTLSTAAAQRIYLLRHGVDLQRFAPASSLPPPLRETLRLEGQRILSVGRLVPKKGFTDMLAALELLMREGIGFEAEIFGGGPLHDDLVRQAQAAGLGRRLRFHGARTQDAIIRAYRRAGLFVLAPVITDGGDRDGIPNVLVEAMACGLPVVSTRVSGIPELITDGVDGILVDPHDPAALAAGMARLLRDSAFAAQLGDAARGKVERLFDIRSTIGRLYALFAGEPGAIASTAGHQERAAA
jgi:glycosyltransferase involved in cell wall biosynthesis